MPELAPVYLTRDPILNARVDSLLGDLHEPIVGMHVGASEANKMWPPEHWSALADRLVDAGVRVVLFGGKAETAIAEQVLASMQRPAISLVGRTSPRELAAAIHRCSLFVGGDTGATHIAALVQKPVIALMGATNPNHTGPYGRQHTTIHLGLSCSPCFRHPTCEGRFDCMRGIEPLRVFNECISKLESQRPVSNMVPA